MTNWLLVFLALYVLVWQPAIVWWMLENSELYQLALLNWGVFLIALIISSICKPNKNKTKENEVKLVQKSEEKVSRIESDEGVAIVEVEKKEEIVVETNKDENQQESLEDKNEVIEENEEGAKEKIDNTKNEKTMKETVSIPKIVQPITWNTAKKRRKRERKWGQWLVLLLTLGIAAVIAFTLWEFLEDWWIAIALFLGRILYLVIGKLFDVNGFYNAKKLFTNWLYIVLILAWIGYGLYTMQEENKSFNLLPEWRANKVTSYIKGWFENDKGEKSVIDTWAIYIFEGTWEVITNLDENDTEVNDGVLNIEGDDVNVEDGEEKIEENTLSAEEAKEKVTMWEAIKSLLSSWVTLSTKTNSTFKYVSKTSELYPYFKTAQEKWMIWSDTDPSKLVSCETFITMKWLAEWWDVWSYVKTQIKNVYWNKATELWKLNWCTKWAYVTKGNL